MHRQNRQGAGSGRQGQVMKVRGPVTMKENGLGQRKKDAPHAAEDLDGLLDRG